MRNGKTLKERCKKIGDFWEPIRYTILDKMIRQKSVNYWKLEKSARGEIVCERRGT